MSAASPTPPVATASGASSRGAQVALSVFLAVLLGLLLVRGYGSRLGARPTEPVVTDLTDLNTADPTELAQVPGVGPKMAEAIVDHRRVHGPFKSVDELRSVRGVGPITFEKIRPQFRVSTPPSVPLAEAPLSPLAPQAQPSVPAPARTPAPRAAPAGAKKIQSGESPINVNTASVTELQRLPSIGPVTAQAIVAARTSAPFQTVNDLDKVKGIGPKTMEKLRPFVVVK